jgi:hypothetical protein
MIMGLSETTVYADIAIRVGYACNYAVGGLLNDSVVVRDKGFDFHSSSWAEL